MRQQVRPLVSFPVVTGEVIGKVEKIGGQRRVRIFSLAVAARHWHIGCQQFTPTPQKTTPIPLSTYFLHLFSCLLPIPHCPLPIAYSPLPIAYSPFPIAYEKKSRRPPPGGANACLLTASNRYQASGLVFFRPRPRLPSFHSPRF